MAKNTLKVRQLKDLPVRNSIINGGMDIWQRGTNFNSAASAQYSADRFRYDKANTSAVHNVFQSGTLPTFAQSGHKSRYSLSVQIGTQDASVASNEHTQIIYRMEGQDLAPLFGKRVRLQFWVLNSVTGTYHVGFRNSAGTRSYVAPYTVNAADTWEFKTIDLTLDTVDASWNFDHTLGMDIIWSLTAGSSFQAPATGSWQAGNYFSAAGAANFNGGTVGGVFRLTQVMLVEGAFDATTSLIFKRAGRSIQDELAMCQRYYEKSAQSITPGTVVASDYAFVSGKVDNSGNVLATVPYKVVKRVSPTVTVYRDDTGASGAARASIQAGGFTAFSAGTTNNSDSFFNYIITGQTPGNTAAITGVWQADAEL